MSASTNPQPVLTVSPTISYSGSFTPKKIEEPEKPKRVAIIGYTFSHRQAPWDSPDWLIWGMNDLHKFITNTRWDGWFDVHDSATIDDNAEHLAWLRQEHPFPIWMTQPRDEFPSAVRLPVEDLVAAVPRDYFTNTVSWMVVMAIETVKWAAGDGAEIGIYGVDMATGSEYAAQRPSCEYFIGLAEAMGIKITIPETSDLLKAAFRYGEETNPMVAKMAERAKEIRTRSESIQGEINRARAYAAEMEATLQQGRGALEMLDYFLGTWTPPKTDPGAQRATNDIRAGGPTP